MHLAIVGATGAVGSEVLKVLERRHFPLKGLRCFASPRSAGQVLSFRGEGVQVEPLGENSFKGIDIALFCAGGNISRAFVPIAISHGAIVIDNSSAFRMDPDVPLIIPEINPHALKEGAQLIASPNCSTTIMLMALAPLHRRFKIERVVATTYQAASGAGQQAIQELLGETKAYLEGTQFERTVIPHPYAFNLFLHNSPLKENGYVEEELKMIFESRKILEDPSIAINATCVRVPVLRAHSEALNVTFCDPITPDAARAILGHSPGIALLEDPNNNRFPMPIDASGQDLVYCGRIRQDTSHPNALDIWVVGDQLLKGAALNAVQIAELILERQKCIHSY